MLGDPQRSESLACAARHHHLTPVVIIETFGFRVDRFPLMRARTLDRRARSVKIARVGWPLDLCMLKISQHVEMDRLLLTLNRPLRVRPDSIRRRYQKTKRETWTR
jgi:hypothetical protein